MRDAGAKTGGGVKSCQARPISPPPHILPYGREYFPFCKPALTDVLLFENCCERGKNCGSGRIQTPFEDMDRPSSRWTNLGLISPAKDRERDRQP